MSDLPAWLDIQAPTETNDSRLADLDPGEREAIASALKHDISLVLMGESEGRNKAQSLNLKVRGTLAILAEAARLGKLEFLPTLQKLETTTFRMTPAVREIAIREANP